jgi:hypothetical protein
MGRAVRGKEESAVIGTQKVELVSAFECCREVKENEGLQRILDLAQFS